MVFFRLEAYHRVQNEIQEFSSRDEGVVVEGRVYVVVGYGICRMSNCCGWLING